MTLAIETRPVPLQQDESGGLRITGTRIPLDTVIFAYLDGDSAEEIVENFPTLNLADVYAVIGYYLDNREEINAYLSARQKEADDLRREIEKKYPMRGIRERLLARQQKKHDQAGG